MITAFSWQNSFSLCPASFCTPRPNLPVTPGISSGFPGVTSGKEPACQFRRHKSLGFDPWVGKIPWRSSWQPTSVFLPGESSWTEEPGRLQSIESESWTWLKQWACWCTPGISWLPTFAFQSPIMKRNSFLGVSSSLLGLHRTVQLQLLQHYWLGYRLGLLWYWMVCQRKAMPKNAQTTAQLHSSHTLVK